MRFLFRRVPSAGRRGTPATISLNASHGGTGDSETLHWRGTIFTILGFLLLTFTSLSLCHCISRFKGQDFFDCAQRINSFRFFFFQNPIDKQAQSLFSNIVIPNSGINLDSCFFSRKTIIIQSLDKSRSGFMGNNAESSVATATGCFHTMLDRQSSRGLCLCLSICPFFPSLVVTDA